MPTGRIRGRIIDPSIRKSCRRRLDDCVDLAGETVAIKLASHPAQLIALVEVSHRGFIVAPVVMRLPQGEVQQLAVPRAAAWAG